MLKNLATILRAAQLYTHAAHNELKGCTFFADHAFAGDTYDALETAYDSTVERAIGLGEEMNLLELGVKAANLAKDLSLDSQKDIFEQLLENEESIRDEIERAKVDASYGTDNLLAQLADDSESRTYKIKQRLKEEK